MNKESATLVTHTFEEIMKKLFSLLPILKEGCESDDEYNYFQREIARLANIADLKILEVIIKQYPELDFLKKNTVDKKE
ncbi:hypothetical protein [Spartinivicinus poritis]|uniref:Uncharacterized protein n=1 Tax=Spartinivicinus poritis TaxID=2994640 RepID=A0ABT5UD71_9GAMM|nr:hypothetical protein [Spartinivicinus sp. A2-2]MDE1464160.1 hypothetical protein [Spartinivicinus sp. A2-2]